MKRTKLYRYLGRNGIITTPILLENVEPIILYELIADAGKILTDGVNKSKRKFVFEDELDNWFEVDDTNSQ